MYPEHDKCMNCFREGTTLTGKKLYLCFVTCYLSFCIAIRSSQNNKQLLRPFTVFRASVSLHHQFDSFGFDQTRSVFSFTQRHLHSPRTVTAVDLISLNFTLCHYEPLPLLSSCIPCVRSLPKNIASQITVLSEKKRKEKCYVSLIILLSCSMQFF